MIKVVAGIIKNKNKVLMCQRKLTDQHSLKWEFPGGKIKKGERLKAGLERELFEELNINAKIGKLLFKTQHSYNSSEPIQLFFYEIINYKGEIKNLNFENIKWVDIKQLNDFDIIEGDLHFINYISNISETKYLNLRREYQKRKKEIKDKLKQFRNIKYSEHFYELVYCLLTPQSSASNAEKAVALLKVYNFQNRDFDPEPLLSQRDFYIRFHRKKAKILSEMKKYFPKIMEQLHNNTLTFELREWLVKNVKGLGYKEASHFLRNIGHRNLAILDRHILRNLVRVGVLDSIPKSLSRKNYLQIEKKFQEFSKKVRIPIDELDLLFWSLETGQILK